MTAAERIAVIVGVGDLADRPSTPEEAQEPAALIISALRMAEADAGALLLSDLDSLDVVDVRSWGYADLPRTVSETLGISPARKHYTPIGGEVPVRMLRAMARRIADGDSRIAALCGAEAAASVQMAARTGKPPPWPAQDAAPRTTAWNEFLHPHAVRHHLVQPLQVYPLYENACRAAWRQSFREAQQESASLLSLMSSIAVTNPAGWSTKAAAAAEIETPARGNRLVAWPYSKQMVANPVVNQGAAILMTSLAEALRRGVPRERMIFVWGGGGTDEARDFSSRDRFDHSPAMNAVLLGAVAALDTAGERASNIELYSCFPCVPKMARRTLGLSIEQSAGVTGGLPFFGAPLSNYMTHAAAAMVRRLRQGGSDTGLLYGQGEHLTKHQCLVLSNHEAPARFTMPDDAQLAATAAAERGPSLTI